MSNQDCFKDIGYRNVKAYSLTLDTNPTGPETKYIDGYIKGNNHYEIGSLDNCSQCTPRYFTKALYNKAISNGAIFINKYVDSITLDTTTNKPILHFDDKT